MSYEFKFCMMNALLKLLVGRVAIVFSTDTHCSKGLNAI